MEHKPKTALPACVIRMRANTGSDNEHKTSCLLLSGSPTFNGIGKQYYIDRLHNVGCSMYVYIGSGMSGDCPQREASSRKADTE